MKAYATIIFIFGIALVQSVPTTKTAKSKSDLKNWLNEKKSLTKLQDESIDGTKQGNRTKKSVVCLELPEINNEVCAPGCCNQQPIPPQQPQIIHEPRPYAPPAQHTTNLYQTGPQIASIHQEGPQMPIMIPSMPPASHTSNIYHTGPQIANIHQEGPQIPMMIPSMPPASHTSNIYHTGPQIAHIHQTGPQIPIQMPSISQPPPAPLPPVIYQTAPQQPPPQQQPSVIYQTVPQQPPPPPPPQQQPSVIYQTVPQQPPPPQQQPSVIYQTVPQQPPPPQQQPSVIYQTVPQQPPPPQQQPSVIYQTVPQQPPPPPPPPPQQPSIIYQPPEPQQQITYSTIPNTPMILPPMPPMPPMPQMPVIMPPRPPQIVGSIPQLPPCPPEEQYLIPGKESEEIISYEVVPVSHHVPSSPSQLITTPRPPYPCIPAGQAQQIPQQQTSTSFATVQQQQQQAVVNQLQVVQGNTYSGTPATYQPSNVQTIGMPSHQPAIYQPPSSAVSVSRPMPTYQQTQPYPNVNYHTVDCIPAAPAHQMAYGFQSSQSAAQSYAAAQNSAYSGYGMSSFRSAQDGDDESVIVTGQSGNPTSPQLVHARNSYHHGFSSPPRYNTYKRASNDDDGNVVTMGASPDSPHVSIQGNSYHGSNIQPLKEIAKRGVEKVDEKKAKA